MLEKITEIFALNRTGDSMTRDPIYNILSDDNKDKNARLIDQYILLMG